jgi:hypothetical protein
MAAPRLLCELSNVDRKPRPVVVRTDVEKALKCTPHAFGVAEATFLGDGLDR